MEFTGNYKKVETRTDWRKDDAYLAFNNEMLNNTFTFEQIVDLIAPFLSLTIDWSEMRPGWIELVKEWNVIEGREDSPEKALGFVGITYLFSLLPFETIGVEKISEVFNLHERNVINLVHFYINSDSHPVLLESGAQDVASMPPVFPPAFQEFVDEQYNRSSFWLAHMVYERRHNLPHYLYEVDPAPSDIHK